MLKLGEKLRNAEIRSIFVFLLKLGEKVRKPSNLSHIMLLTLLADKGFQAGTLNL